MSTGRRGGGSVERFVSVGQRRRASGLLGEIWVDRVGDRVCCMFVIGCSRRLRVPAWGRFRDPRRNLCAQKCRGALVRPVVLLSLNLICGDALCGFVLGKSVSVLPSA